MVFESAISENILLENKPLHLKMLDFTSEYSSEDRLHRNNFFQESVRIETLSNFSSLKSDCFLLTNGLMNSN